MDQPLPDAIEEILAPYPDLLVKLRRYVHDSVNEDSITPCVDRVIWTIKDTLSSMMVTADDQSRKASEAGDSVLAGELEAQRRAIALARSDGYGMNDFDAILKICAGRG